MEILGRVWRKLKVKFGKERFPSNYQNQVGFNARQLLHNNSLELLDVIKNFNILKKNELVFEIGCAGGRNLHYFLKDFPNIKIFGNDLFFHSSYENMSDLVKEKINFLECDTLNLFETCAFKVDLLLSSDHLMHLESSRVELIINLIKNKWKPKYILLRERRLRAEDLTHPRICHDEIFKKLESDYEIIYNKICRFTRSYKIKIYKIKM